VNGTTGAAQDNGGLRAVLQALRPSPLPPCVLAVVVATEGSTYRKAGALIVLPADGARVGWLSGGCLEAELETTAAEALRDSRARHLRLDTRGDDDLLFGSASGCRGVVELLLLPLDETAPLLAALRSLDTSAGVELELCADGAGRATSAAGEWQWPAGAAPAPGRWSLRLRAPERLLLLGAGPESAPLLRLAHLLGWSVDVVESRARWHAALAGADALHRDVAGVPALLASGRYAAAVVMSHHYSRDLAALQHAAAAGIGWIGLLGPVARRDALLAELDADLRARLLPRLQAPVGLRLGGEGPEAIALSIMAALQSRDGA